MTAPQTDLTSGQPALDLVDEEPAKVRATRVRLGRSMLSMGVLHVVKPEPFQKIIPEALGAPRFWNLVAAAAEMGAGVLLLTGDAEKRRMGAWLATATMVGVFPANINMALKAGAPTNPAAIAAWLRLPMQYPMVRTAYRLTK